MSDLAREGSRSVRRDAPIPSDSVTDTNCDRCERSVAHRAARPHRAGLHDSLMATSGRQLYYRSSVSCNSLAPKLFESLCNWSPDETVDRPLCNSAEGRPRRRAVLECGRQVVAVNGSRANERGSLWNRRERSGVEAGRAVTPRALRRSIELGIRKESALSIPGTQPRVCSAGVLERRSAGVARRSAGT